MRDTAVAARKALPAAFRWVMPKHFVSREAVERQKFRAELARYRR